MTYKQWEKALKKELSSLPRAERDRTLEYYREMKDEKLANGETERAVTAEFGDPKDCARRIARANYADLESADERAKKPFAPVTPARKEKTHFSAAEIVGLFFASLLLVLPLLAVMVSVLISFGAISLGSAAISLAGVVFALGAPFLGVSGVGIGAYVGIGIGATGLGILLAIGFFFATKYTALGIKAFLRAVYVRR